MQELARVGARGGVEARPAIRAACSIVRANSLANLFKNQGKSESESSFSVFIRANALRHAAFEDLRRMSEQDAAKADIPMGCRR
ncbi:MAG: hypothetical protein H0W72_15360 [Planctomycetes bacterium]|nr:hypothetical protein [Planctomycetota bacterium]